VAIRYVRASGNDANGGTTPAAAWLTIGKAVGASGMASGDTCYVGAGTYREVVATVLAPVAETRIIGDTTGQFTGDAGEVVLTAYTAGDSAAPSASATLTATSTNFYTWERFTFVSGTGTAATVSATNWTFRDCTFIGKHGAYGFNLRIDVPTAGGVLNHLVDRCRFHGTRADAIALVGVLHSADYDINLVVRACVMDGNNNGINTLNPTGTGTGKPVGVRCYANTFRTGTGIALTTTGHGVAAGSEAIGNLFLGATGISAGSTTQIVSNYNRFWGSTPYTNVTAGANDNATSAMAWHPDVGQSVLWGEPPRPYLTPQAGNPHLAFVASSVTSMPALDMTGRQHKSGSRSGTHVPVGALGRHDIARVGTTITPDSGTNMEIIGPGDHDFEVAVSAVATTFTIKVRTSGYGGTTYPTMSILNGGGIGVADATATATSASATAYETLTLGPFTPTASGIVTLRLVNNTNNEVGVVAFDTFGAT